jgi:hypothetical protein
MKSIPKLYHTSRLMMFMIAILELGISYGFASLAIDRGNLWWYLLSAIFLVRFLRELFRIIGKTINGHKTADAS